MLIALLGFIDIFAGIVLAVSNTYTLESLAFALGIILLLKGGYSLVTSLSSGYFLDWMGWLDIVSSIALFLAQSGHPFGFFKFMGILLLLKGIYSSMPAILGIVGK